MNYPKLAHIHPESKRDYTAQSARHQDIALSRLRNGLFNITQQNIHERFILAYIVMVMTFYSIGNPLDEDHHLTTQELGQSLFLGQGIMNLISVPENWHWVKTGPLAMTLNNPIRHDAVPHPTGAFVERLDHLSSSLIMHLAGSPSATRARSSCMLAVDALRRAYCVILSAGREDPAAIWSWPTAMPSDFRDFVCANHPVALVILGYFAALVQCLRDRWYLSSWSEKVFAALEETLDEEWRSWLDFPKAYHMEDLEASIKEYQERRQGEATSDRPPSWEDGGCTRSGD